MIKPVHYLIISVLTMVVSSSPLRLWASNPAIMDHITTTPVTLSLHGAPAPPVIDPTSAGAIRPGTAPPGMIAPLGFAASNAILETGVQQRGVSRAGNSRAGAQRTGMPQGISAATIVPLMQKAFALSGDLGLRLRGHLDRFSCHAGGDDHDGHTSIAAYSVFIGPSLNIAQLGRHNLIGQLSAGYRLLDPVGGLTDRAASALCMGSGASLCLEQDNLELRIGISRFRPTSDPTSSVVPRYRNLDTSQFFMYITYQFGR